jgi:hypothetical protein
MLCRAGLHPQAVALGDRQPQVWAALSFDQLRRVCRALIESGLTDSVACEPEAEAFSSQAPAARRVTTAVVPAP